jgi:hypothetical protein
MKLGLHRLGERISAVSGMGRRHKGSGEGEAGGECSSEKWSPGVHRLSPLFRADRSGSHDDRNALVTERPRPGFQKKQRRADDARDKIAISASYDATLAVGAVLRNPSAGLNHLLSRQKQGDIRFLACSVVVSAPESGVVAIVSGFMGFRRTGAKSTVTGR